MSRFSFGLCATLLPVLGLLLACGSAHATTYTGNSSTGYDDKGQCTTIGPDNGDFSDPRNWGDPCTPGSVPGAGGLADLAGHGVHGTGVSVGTLQTSGGSLTADSINADNLVINGGAVIGRDATASTLTVNTSVAWTDGALSTIAATFAPTCTATISGDYNNAGSGSGGKTINGGAVLNNQGTLTWSGSAFSGAPGTLNNSGTFNMAGDGLLNWPNYGAGITLINSGSFIKTGGTGTTGISSGGTFISNGGTLGAQTGVFDLSGITGNGNGPTKLLGNITIAAGDGVVQQSDGYFIDGNFTVNGTWRITGGASVGQATFSGPGHIDWQGGGFGNDYNDSTGTLQHSNFVLTPGFRADMSGPNNHNVGALTNQGILTWSGPGNVGGGTLKNVGTFNLLTDGPLGESNGGLTPSIINTGTIAKTGGTGAVTTSYHYLDNSGTIDIQHGTLELNNNVNGGNDVFRTGTLIKGAGKLVTYYPTICSGTIAVDGTLQLGGGGFYCGTTFKGAGHLDWLVGGIDKATFASGFTVNAIGGGEKFLATTAPCTNAGTFNWKGGATLNNRTSFTNSGVFNVLAPGFFFGGTFNNRGTLNTYARGNTFINGFLGNTGTLNLGSATSPGTLQIRGGDNNSFVSTGTVNAFITGARAGQFSQIQGLSDPNAATGVTLGGTLALNFKAGYTPDANASFPLVKVFADRASYSKTFRAVKGAPTVNGRAMKLFYHSGDVTLATPLTISGKAVRWVVSRGTLSQQGVTGTTITLAKQGGATTTTKVPSNGSFAFHDLEAGTYTLAAPNDSVTFDPVTAKITLPTKNITGISPDAVVLFQTYAISAKVVDDAGAPVSGVTLSVTSKAGSRSATTDSKGVALFSDLGANTYTVTPQAQSGFTFAPTKASVKLPTVGTHNLSPNGSVSFTRTPKTAAGVAAPSFSPSAGAS